MDSARRRCLEIMSSKIVKSIVQFLRKTLCEMTRFSRLNIMVLLHLQPFCLMGTG